MWPSITDKPTAYAVYRVYTLRGVHFIKIRKGAAAERRADFTHTRANYLRVLPDGVVGHATRRFSRLCYCRQAITIYVKKYGYHVSGLFYQNIGPF